MSFKKTFEKTVIGGIEVKNRFVRSATSDVGAVKGGPSEEIFQKYEDLCKGEVGLVTMGYLTFASTDHFTDGSLSISKDTVPTLRKVTDMAHGYNAKMVAQINHASTQLFYDPKVEIYGPSEYTDPVSGLKATELSTEQIKELINEFGQAAAYVKEAGFDGVQLHGAHGYLLNKFLSPKYNKRTDEYGSGLTERMKIIVDIYNEIKRTCGESYPVSVKLNSSDHEHEGNGVTHDDFLAISKELARIGVKAIEVSGGTLAGTESFSRPKKHTAYHLDIASKLAGSIDSSVILVGGLRDVEQIEQIVNETKIEGIAISRAFIRESNLIKRWKEGDRSQAKCIACNKCFNPNGIKCFFNLSKEEQKALQGII